MENELPPRLIHCLRLFRLIELGRTSEYWSEKQYSEIDGDNDNVQLKPISTKAVAKVENLLKLLCIDISLGEQLRPHLFGLLALSDHAYPKNGCHIAKAASAIVCRFAENCLSPSLVWFLHANKMIINMTDDLKELIGMTSSGSIESSVSPRSMCLYGKAAESDGMWICALSAVVGIVVNSCKHDTVKLLHDFDSAGGYYVISYSIINSSRSNISKLLELAINLTCCISKESPHRSISPSQTVDDDTLLVKNVEAFREILFDLASRSIPFLVDFVDRQHGELPNFLSLQFIQNASVDSVNIAISRDLVLNPDNILPSFEIASEILMTVLQIYTSHPKNFGKVESSFFMLSQFLVSFPTFSDDSTKVCILKMLEYVCTTGLVDVTTSAPVTVACEIFYALCVTLLRDKSITNSSYNKEQVLHDAESLCGTLEKALQMNEYINKIICDGGFLDYKLSNFLGLVTVAKLEMEDDESANDNGYQHIEAPFLFICRILRLIVTRGPSTLTRAALKVDDNFERINLNILLTTAVADLSEESSRAALLVFQEVMGISVETLENNIACLFDLIGVLLKSYNSDNSEKRKRQSIVRQTHVLNVLITGIASNEHAYPAFLKCNGFGLLLEILQSLKGAFTESGGQQTESRESSILNLVQAIFSVIDSILIYATTIGSNTDAEVLFYSMLAQEVAETGMLRSTEHVSWLLNLTLALMDPILSLSCPTQDVQSLKNAGVAKLVVSIITL